MKIGIEAQRIFRKNKHGMELVALEVIRQIQKLDRKNEYIIFANKDTDIECLAESDNVSIVQSESMPYPIWEQIYLPKAAAAHQVDILHCTANTAPIFTKIPLVLTLHDIIYLENTDFGGSVYQNFGNIYRKIIVPRIIDKCKAIITVSNFEKQRIIEELDVDQGKVKVVYNAVSSEFEIIDNVELLHKFREKYELPVKFIMFLGNTAPKKNSKRVIQAYAQYCLKTKDSIPLVVLDFPKENVLSFLMEVKCGHLIDQIVCLGYIERKEMPYFYNLASIFLYPSIRESFGMPILEAMACGTPVITSNTSAMPEIAQDAAILVNPLEEEEIAENIMKLLLDNSLYQLIRKKGILRATQFHWEMAAKNIIAMYQEVDKSYAKY